MLHVFVHVHLKGQFGRTMRLKELERLNLPLFAPLKTKEKVYPFFFLTEKYCLQKNTLLFYRKILLRDASICPVIKKRPDKNGSEGIHTHISKRQRLLHKRKHKQKERVRKSTFS